MGNEINEKIHRLVFGECWHWLDDYKITIRHGKVAGGQECLLCEEMVGYQARPDYANSIADAWRVVEKMTEPPTDEKAARFAANSLFMFGFQAANMWSLSSSEAAREICQIAIKILNAQEKQAAIEAVKE